MRIGLLVPLWLLAACVHGENGMKVHDPDAMTCGADGLQELVGQPADAHDFKVDGRPLRILPPGSAMTMDHRPDRLNVDVDEDGLITRIWCG